MYHYITERWREEITEVELPDVKTGVVLKTTGTALFLALKAQRG